jgi:hypothetical protein
MKLLTAKQQEQMTRALMKEAKRHFDVGLALVNTRQVAQ